MVLSRLFTFALFVQCIQQVVSVDRSKFRTCEQTAFCRRNRNPDSSPPSYHVMKQSIESSEQDGLSAILENDHPDAPQYKLNVKFYDSGVSRIQVTCLYIINVELFFFLSCSLTLFFLFSSSSFLFVYILFYIFVLPYVLYKFERFVKQHH